MRRRGKKEGSYRITKPDNAGGSLWVTRCQPFLYTKPPFCGPSSLPLSFTGDTHTRRPPTNTATAPTSAFSLRKVAPMFLSRFSGVLGSWEREEEEQEEREKKTMRKENGRSGNKGVEVFRSGANRSHNNIPEGGLQKGKPEARGGEGGGGGSVSGNRATATSNGWIYSLSLCLSHTSRIIQQCK